MKRIFTCGIITLTLAFGIAAGILSVPAKTVKAEGEITINETTFPDERFRYWLKYTDYGKDGKLTDSEIAGVDTIIIKNFDVTSLKGIEYFTSLKTLYCFGNEIESLDLSKNTALEQLVCDDNKLTELDLSKNTALKKLHCSGNDLTSLDLSFQKALNGLYCAGNKLTSLDVSMLTELTDLTCYNNNLESLNVSKNTKLTGLSCYGNKLESLDVSNNVDLRTLSCENNKLQSLKLGYLPSLFSLSCYNNELTSIETKEIFFLEKLKCDGNNLESLDVSRNTHLDSLYCYENPFKWLYIPDIDISDLKTDDGTECIKLGYSDWTYIGADWNIDMNDPSKTTAVAKFACSKDIREDCRTEEPMHIRDFSSIDPDCENAGSLDYVAVVVHYVSRTGEFIEEKKTVTIPAKGHKWSDWKDITPATAGKAGSKTHTCSVCGKSETVAIAKLTATPTPKLTAKPTKAAEPSKKAEPTKDPNVSLKLDKSKANIVCGDMLTLKAALKGSTSKISWKSSDSKIAKVDKKGKVLGKMAGTVTVTATAAGKTAKCVVTVLYKDVTNSKDFWYEPANIMTSKGIVKGYENQTMFRPSNVCTRAQMVTFIWRLKGGPDPKANTCKFSDVNKSDYFYKACIWGNEKGIVEGYKDGTFGPKIVCARRHAVTFLWRLANKPKPVSTKNKFKDVKKTDYFYQATLWASENKILAGYSDGTFRPNGGCLRRQMVTFLYKYDKFVNG